MMGARLTSATPEAAPDAVFAGDAATLKSEQLPQRLSRLQSSVVSCRPPICKADLNSNARDRPRLTMVKQQASCHVTALPKRSPPSLMQVWVT
jgi:hypothetical protein